MEALAHPEVAAVLGEARQAYVAVDSKHGPHVTPQLYGVSDGKLWFFAASTTLKAKVLRRRPRVGVTVVSGRRTVVIGGRAAALDAGAPAELLAQFPEWHRAARGAANFSLRNAVDLAGFVTDALQRRAGRLPPPRRVLFAVEPDRVAHFDGDAVSVALGGWAGAATSAPVAASGLGPADAGLASGVPSVAAWSTTDGPLAFPAAWDAATRSATVLSALVDIAGLPDRSPMSVVFDEYNRPGPGAKRGTLLRGEGRLRRADHGGVRLEMDVQRAVEWDGVRTRRTDPCSAVQAVAGRAAPGTQSRNPQR